MIIGSLALAALTYLLIQPFLAWPGEPHMGVFFRWPFFRPGEPVPKQLILGNQGFSRIYLYHLADAIIRLLGRKHLQAKVTLVQAGSLWLTSVVLVGLCIGPLGMAPAAAYGGAVVYLFVSTRPQFTFMRYNSETHYSLCIIIGLWGLTTAMGGEYSLPLIGASVLLMTFGAINAKIIFLLDVGLLGLAFLLLTGWPWPVFFTMIVAGLLALALFYLLFKKYLVRDSVSQLVNYARWASAHPLLSHLADTYRAYLKPTPFLATLILSLCGLPLLLASKQGVLPVVWFVSSLVLLVAQMRLAQYHFLLLFPAMSLAVAALFNGALSFSPWLFWLLIAAYACFGVRTFIPDTFLHYGNRPLKEKISSALGQKYYTIFDLRLDRLAAEHATHPGPFLPWGNVPQLNLMTDEAPHTYMGVYRALVHRLFPHHQQRMVEAVTTVEHGWVYDLSWGPMGLDGFNPLAVMAGLGVCYVPVKRSENIVHYQLVGTTSGWPVNPDVRFYVETGQTADLLRQELESAGRAVPLGPRGHAFSLMELCEALHGRTAPDIGSLLDDCLDLVDTPSGSSLRLFAAAAALLSADTETAVRQLESWRDADTAYPAMSPSMAVAEWYLAWRTGSGDSLFPLDDTTLNRVSMLEAYEVCHFLATLLAREELPGEARDAVIDCLRSVSIPETDHKDDMLTHKLSLILSPFRETVDIADLVGQRVLLVRFAPMEVLQEALSAFGGSARSLSLVIQQGAKEAADSLHRFDSMHLIPDGPFARTKATDALADRLAHERYDSCVIIMRNHLELQGQGLMQFIEGIGARQVYAYVDHTRASRTLADLTPAIGSR